MQAELIRFVSGIERASRLYKSLLKLSDIADQVRTTEEKIENLLEQSQKYSPEEILQNESNSTTSTSNITTKILTALKTTTKIIQNTATAINKTLISKKK